MISLHIRSSIKCSFLKYYYPSLIILYFSYLSIFDHISNALYLNSIIHFFMFYASHNISPYPVIYQINFTIYSLLKFYYPFFLVLTSHNISPYLVIYQMIFTKILQSIFLFLYFSSELETDIYIRNFNINLRCML